MNTKEHKYGIELPVSLHAQVKAMAASLQLKLKDAAREAFSNWLTAKQGVQSSSLEQVGSSTTEPPTPPYRPDNRRWHDALEDVLNTPDERIGIEKNLEWAMAKLGEAKRGRAPARRKVG